MLNIEKQNNKNQKKYENMSKNHAASQYILWKKRLKMSKLF